MFFFRKENGEPKYAPATLFGYGLKPEHIKPPKLWVDLLEKFKPGDYFSYLGIEMIVTWVIDIEMHEFHWASSPKTLMFANYVDKNGVIREKGFRSSELDHLIYGGSDAKCP